MSVELHHTSSQGVEYAPQQGLKLVKNNSNQQQATTGLVRQNSAKQSLNQNLAANPDC
jgi:hypothetical protein